MTSMRGIKVQRGHHTTVFGNYVCMHICCPSCGFVELVVPVCDRSKPRTVSVIGVSLLWRHVLMGPV